MNFPGLHSTGFKYLGGAVRLPWFPSLLILPDTGHPALVSLGFFTSKMRVIVVPTSWSCYEVCVSS